MALSPVENNEVVREFFDSAWNKGVVLEELLSSDAIDHSFVGGKTKSEPGSESFKQIVAMFHRAMPDIQATVLDEIFVGDKCVQRWSLTGTDTGGVMGMPASGKSLTFTGTTTVRMNDEGKIAERWANVDELGLLQQLGVVPPPPGA
jgi:predicted ester cyclase